MIWKYRPAENSERVTNAVVDIERRSGIANTGGSSRFTGKRLGCVWLLVWLITVFGRLELEAGDGVV